MSKYYYKVKYKQTENYGMINNDADVDCDYREIFRFKDGIVIEAEKKVSTFIKEYKTSDPIIKTHLDWYKSHPKDKPEKKDKDGKIIGAEEIAINA